MDFWQELRAVVLDQTHLDTDEKLCLIVLMSYGRNVSEGDVALSSEQLARDMGSSIQAARRAFESLSAKGFLSEDGVRPPKVLGAQVLGERAHHQPSGAITAPTFSEFASAETSSAGTGSVETPLMDTAASPTAAQRRVPVGSAASSKHRAPLEDAVMELVAEPISRREASIILAFADDDVEQVRQAYVRAQRSQVSDTLGVMMSLLQKKEAPQASEASDDVHLEASNRPRASQLKIQQYQKMKGSL